MSKMGVTTVAVPHAGAVWRMRLASAFRTAIACTIVGCTALYGPDPIQHQITYPSVAYVTAILIVSDATLGTTLRGCWHAFCATVMVVPASVLCFKVVDPARFTEAGAAVAVALSAFVVAVPESLSLLGKRIGFVQVVIIYVGAVVRGHGAGPVTHPLHIAACTALGASASVLALMLPFPWLAVTEVKKQFELYRENASERTSLYMKAFLSEDKSTANDLISEAKPIAEIGTKLLNHINLTQEGVKWENPRIRRTFVKTGDRLDEMETPIKGMEMALTAIPSFPLSVIDNDLKTVLQSAQTQQILKLDHAKCFVPFDDAMTVPEQKHDIFNKTLNSLVNISPTHEHLSVFFFLWCFELLINNSSISPKPESVNNQNDKETSVTKKGKQRLLFAFKCSISLGLAVLLGMLFDKKNGYWSGLTIAISFVTGKQPIFTVANARVQGTAIGTVYGVLGSILLHRFSEIRFVILLPWIVFTSLLHHSQMYGQAGGISAVIGALLILGRKNYGPVNDFAIARITEVCIGLLCFIFSELLLQPARAATLIKLQLSKCLKTLDECLNQIVVCSITPKEHKDSIIFSMKEKIKKLKSDIKDLKRLSKDSKSEPDFWFLPFRSSCYHTVQESLSKTVDLLHIMIHTTQSTAGLSQDLQELINCDLEAMKEYTSSSIKRLEKITSMKSIDTFERSRLIPDLESGNRSTSSTGLSIEAATKVMDAFIQHSKEATDRFRVTEGEDEAKGKTILHLNSLGFCIDGLMAETMAVEKCVKEIVRSENPSRKVDFKELFYKIDRVGTQ